MKKLIPLLLALSLAVLLLAACQNAETTAEISASSLTGYQIVGLNGDKLGEVQEILLDSEDGRIEYVIVTLEGDGFHYSKAAFVPGAAPMTAVPWNYFTLDQAAEQLRLRVGNSLIYDAPRLANDSDLLKNDWDEPVQSYWRTFEPNIR